MNPIDRYFNHQPPTATEVQKVLHLALNRAHLYKNTGLLCFTLFPVPMGIIYALISPAVATFLFGLWVLVFLVAVAAKISGLATRTCLRVIFDPPQDWAIQKAGLFLRPKDLSLFWQHPGFKDDDFLTPAYRWAAQDRRIGPLEQLIVQEAWEAWNTPKNSSADDSIAL